MLGTVPETEERAVNLKPFPPGAQILTSTTSSSWLVAVRLHRRFEKNSIGLFVGLLLDFSSVILALFSAWP